MPVRPHSARDGSVRARLGPMNALTRHHVSVTGRADGPAIVFAHGFGCDQHMWRWVAPAFRDDFRVVLFDHAGAGEADPAAYDEERHA